MGLGLRRRLEDAAAAHPLLRRALTVAYMVRTDLLSRKARHPVDRVYGVRTQSHVPLYLNRTGSAADTDMVPYGGCVASVLRHAIARLAPVEASSFVDLGCGKGRALVIAAEWPFARVLGVELNPDVAAAARANARRVARRFPDRTPIEVRVGDASAPDLPAGDLVVFLYHPFGRPLIDRLCTHLAAAAGETGRSIAVIYENPVHGAAFDAHPSFVRDYAAMLPCADDERAFAFDPEEAIVVWRSARAGHDTPDPVATAPIVTVKPGFRVVVGDPQRG